MLQQDEKPVSTLILDIEYPEIAGWRGIDENKHVPNVGRVGRPDASTSRKRNSDGGHFDGDKHHQVAGWEDYQHSQLKAPLLGRGEVRSTSDTEPNLAGWQDYSSASAQEVVPHVRDPRAPEVSREPPQNINNLGTPTRKWSEAIASAERKDAQTSCTDLCPTSDSEINLQYRDESHRSHSHRHHKHHHRNNKKREEEQEQEQKRLAQVRVSNTFKLIRALGAWEKKIKPPWMRMLLLPTGTMPVWSNYVRKYPLLDFIDYLLRGLGGTAFSNNPITGICVLLTLLIADQWKAVCAVIGVTASTTCALGLNFNRTAIRSGLFGYNGVLAALAMATFHAGGDWDWKLIPFLVFVCGLTTPILQVLAKVLIPTWSITPLGFPSLIAVLFYIAGTPLYSRIESKDLVMAAQDGSDLSLDFVSFLSAWFSGVSGTLYLNDAAMLSPILLIGVAIFSPLLAVAYVIGAGVGTLYAWGVGVSIIEIKLGLWGINGALAACYMATFYVVTVRGLIIVIACAVVATFMNAGFITLLHPANIPALGFGSNFAALLFLLMQGLVFRLFPVAPVDVTTPEDHLHRLHTLQKLVARWIAIWRAHKQEKKLQRLAQEVNDDRNDEDDLEDPHPKKKASNLTGISDISSAKKSGSNSMIKFRSSGDSGPLTQVTPPTPKMSSDDGQAKKRQSQHYGATSESSTSRPGFQPVKSLQSMFKKASEKIVGKGDEEEKRSLLSSGKSKPLGDVDEQRDLSFSAQRQYISSPGSKGQIQGETVIEVTPRSLQRQVRRNMSESTLITSHDDVEVTSPFDNTSNSSGTVPTISTSFSLLPKFPEEIEEASNKQKLDAQENKDKVKSNSGSNSGSNSATTLPLMRKSSDAVKSTKPASRSNSASPSPSASLTKFDDSLVFASPARSGEDDLL